MENTQMEYTSVDKIILCLNFFAHEFFNDEK